MKKTGWKQLAIGIAGALCCRVPVFGCWPLIPAFFTAAYLEERGRWFLSVGMIVGMIAFLPLTAIAKYAMAVFFAAFTIRLCEWADKHCYAAVGAFAASFGTLALSVFGGMFDFRNRPSAAAAVCEAVFIFGFTILAARGIHLFLEEGQKAVLPGEVRSGYQEKRLLNYAKSFEGLAAAFLSMDGPKEMGIEDAGRLQREMAGRICGSCDICAVCWEPENPAIGRIFGRLAENLLERGRPDEATQQELAEHCRYFSYAEREALSVFEQARANQAWYNRLLEHREIIAEQLDAMAFIMEDCAGEAKLLDGEEAHRISKIRYRAKECGMDVEEAHLFEKNDGHIRAIFRVRARWGNCVAVRELTRAVCTVMNLRMKPHKDTRTFVGKEIAEIIYEEEPKFHVVHGVARQTKDGEEVSGDQFSFLEKEDGGFLLCLSDGMGSGAAASRESEFLLDLLERFVEAGFAEETALRMMNAAMVVHGEGERYSSVDVSSVNLYTGEASFYKIGASATFIRRRDGSVEGLLSTSLPIGASVRADIEQAKKQLLDGDFLVMVTDGVLEYFGTEHPEEMLEAAISGIRTNHPGLLAKKILDYVMEKSAGEVRDDMTVLAAAIWNSGHN